MKTIEEHFASWEGEVFGFGYGTGEQFIIQALKTFTELCNPVHSENNSYEYRKLEEVLSPTVAWLLINILCHADIIEYGGSPRFGWLTKKGDHLKEFLSTRTLEEIYDIIQSRRITADYCSPNCCTCGPNGYEKGRKCPNPFWTD